MRDDSEVMTERGIAVRTTVGFHPRDGRHVACLVVHPEVDTVDALFRLERFAAALGLGGTCGDRLVEVPSYRATVTAGGGWATLWVGDEVELVAPHEPGWTEALLARGWVVVVIGWTTELAGADNGALLAYLTTQDEARVGLVRAP